MNSLKKKFGIRIRVLRKEMKLTQEQLAEKANMEYKSLGAIERGERNITLKNVEKIANGFGLDICQLFIFPETSWEIKEKIPDVTDRKRKELDKIFRTVDEESKETLLEILKCCMKLRKESDIS